MRAFLAVKRLHDHGNSLNKTLNEIDLFTVSEVQYIILMTWSMEEDREMWCWTSCRQQEVDQKSHYGMLEQKRPQSSPT